jgi:hypothetical protein
MKPGTIVQSPESYFYLVLAQPMANARGRQPITVLTTDPWELNNVFSQVYSGDNVYYQVPGAGWLSPEQLNTLQVIDIIEDQGTLLAIASDPLIVTQLAASSQK